MRKDEQKAIILRLKGYSYNEINRELGVPKSTLSGWFVDLQLSEKAKERLRKRHREKSYKGLLKASKLQTHRAKKRAVKIKKQATKEINNLDRYELLLVGAALLIQFCRGR